jgi:hypothetical protein
MADLSVKTVTTGDNAQVAPDNVAPNLPAPPSAAVATTGESHYDGVRSGRKAIATPRLQLQAPGIKGTSTPAMTDGLGPGWDNIL